MIRRRGDRGQRGAPGLDTSSLIDVSFLLLIYFLVTSTLDPREGDIGLTMPGIPDGTTTVVEFDHPVIEVDAAGIVRMSSEILDADPDQRTLALLDDRLRTWSEAARLRRDGADLMVEIRVDDEVPGQRFVDVLNSVTGAGIERIALGDFAPDSSPSP